jgi:hypothetical protein
MRVLDRIPAWGLVVAWWALFAVGIAAAVAGCSDGTEAAAAAAVPDPAGLAYYVDPETGCQYLTPRYREGGIVPRAGADGKHMGCRGLQ